MHRYLRRALTASVASALVFPLLAASASAHTVKKTADSHPSLADLQRSLAKSGHWSWKQSETPTVVMSGLNNPRQLSLQTDQRTLLVAEAGKGGPACGGTSPDGSTQCLGTTGSVSAIIFPQHLKNAKPLRIIKGLLSGAGPDGTGAVGSDGVSARALAHIYVQMTFAPPEAIPPGFPTDQLGYLLKAHPWGPLSQVANISAYEFAHDPDHQGPDSNPYAVLALPGRELVADAAANDVLSVSKNGTVSLFKVFPNITTGACAGMPNDAGTTGCDFVPTSLAVGPDGGIYVGALAAEVPGAAEVVKLDPRTAKVLHTWTGFTTVTGVAVAKDGALYVSELEAPSKAGAPGAVVRITRNGTRTTVPVPFPAGLAVDRWNNVYVSAFSISPDTGMGIPGVDSSGQVWRMRFPGR